MSSETSEWFPTEYADDAFEGPRRISPLLLANTGTGCKSPIVSELPDTGRKSSPWTCCMLSSIGETRPYAVSPSDTVIPAPLDKLVDSFREFDVVPQPRYPPSPGASS